MITTAATALRQIGRRASMLAVEPLHSLDPREVAAVTRELSAVKRGARIDVDLLVQTVRERLRLQSEADAARPPDLMAAWRYSLTLMSPEELASLESDLSRRVDDGEGDEPFEPFPLGSPGERLMSHLAAIGPRLDASDDDDPFIDDEDDDAPRRIPRYRLQRPRHMLDEEVTPPATSPPARAKSPFPAVPTRSLLHGKAFGARLDGRPYGCPQDADYDAWSNPSKPAWLLSEDDEAD